MKSQAFRELPALIGLIKEAVDKVRPRQAFVTHTKQGKVRVRFGDDAPGYTWYPTVISGVQVGDQVSLLPTGDNGYIALPVMWGSKNIVLGWASYVSPGSLFGTALGRAARVQNNSQRGQAIGDYAQVSNSQGGQVFGWNSTVTNSQTAMAFGYNADVVDSADAVAFGSDTDVGPNSPRSYAFGKNAVLPANTPDTTVWGAKRFEVKPSPLASTLASELVLYDTAGNAVVVSAASLLRLKPIIDSNGANQSITLTTAGEYPVTNAALEISGLVPGASYKAAVTVVIRAAGGSGSATFGFHAASNGATSFLGSGPVITTAATQAYVFAYSSTRVVGADGKITVTPAVRWASGTVVVSAGYVTVTVVPD